MTDVERKLEFPRDIITVGMNPDAFSHEQRIAAFRAGNSLLSRELAKSVVNGDKSDLFVAKVTYELSLDNIRAALDRNRQ